MHNLNFYCVNIVKVNSNLSLVECDAGTLLLEEESDLNRLSSVNEIVNIVVTSPPQSLADHGETVDSHVIHRFQPHGDIRVTCTPGP